MATREEYGLALQKAHEAGDTEGAIILAKAYSEAPLTQAADTPKESIGRQALKNLPADLKNIGEGTIQAVSHPIDTIKGLGSLVRGGLQNTVIPDSANEWMINHGVTDSRQVASDFAKPFKEDFGSVESLKNAVATHPATTFLNATTLLSGLSGATRGLSKIAEPVVNATGRTAGTIIGELGTHTGGETIRDAALAGFTGGDKLKALTDNMRNKVPQAAIVDLEKGALSNIAKNDSHLYTEAMNKLRSDKTILDYKPIEQAARSAMQKGSFEGASINKQATGINRQLADAIAEWSGKPHGMSQGVDISKFHTIEGLDALKKKIGNIRQESMPGTPARVAANEVYSAVKGAIEKQSPEYSDIMAKSQAGIKLRKEITNELSLGERGTDSTALRKALSIPRNNANTNYGNRVNMAQLLESNGADNLMSMLNGQALNSFKPRGLGGAVASGLGGYGVASMNPLVIPAMLAQSPRLMGELAVKTGQGARIAKDALNSSGAIYDKIGIKPAIISAILQQQQERK